MTAQTATRHLWGHLPEFTACGVAFDAHDSGDYDEKIVFAASGESVNCPHCAAVVAYYKGVDGRKVRAAGVSS